MTRIRAILNAIGRWLADDKYAESAWGVVRHEDGTPDEGGTGW